MSIDHIETFIYVNHFGSMNKAAKALFLSQPTVTARIQSLERELAVKLFDRVGRRLVMTDEGKDFLPYAESILQSYRSGIKHLQKKSAIDEIVIGCTGLVSNYLIPQILPIFKRNHPDVKIKIVTATTEEIESKVASREVDIGFIRTSSNQMIISKKVFQSPIHFFVSANHPFFEKQSINLEQLVKAPIVFYECGSLDWTLIKNLFHHLDTLPNIVYEVDHLETAKALILNDSGASFLPEISVRKEVASDLLRAIDISDMSDVSLKIEMIYLNGEKPLCFDELYQLAYEERKHILSRK